MDLFNINSEKIPGEIKNLPRFIIRGYNYIRHAEKSVLMTDIERKLNEYLDKGVTETKMTKL